MDMNRCNGTHFSEVRDFSFSVSTHLTTVVFNLRKHRIFFPHIMWIMYYHTYHMCIHNIYIERERWIDVCILIYISNIILLSTSLIIHITHIYIYNLSPYISIISSIPTARFSINCIKFFPVFLEPPKP